MAQRQTLWPILTVLAILLVWMQVSCSNSDRWAITGDKQQEATGSMIAFTRGNWKGQELRTDIYVVNPDGTRETRLTQTRERETNPVFSPDGEKIAFIRGRDSEDVYQIEKDIYVMNPDGTGERRLTHVAAGLTYPDSSQLAWSPDSEKIAFVDGSVSAADIYTIDVDGTNRTRLTNSEPSADRLTGINYAAWSPDGEKIVFQRVYDVQESGSASASASAGPGTSTISEIYVMNADGTDLRKLSIESAYPDASSPAWSPESKKIAFTVSRRNSRGISTINADGTDQTRVTGNSSRFQWSPNGEITFVGAPPPATFEPSDTIDIYKISADGTNRTRLTHDDASEHQLSWSPDGERLAYYTIRIGGGNTEYPIYVMNADGTGRTSVADDIVGEPFPLSWGGTD
jgi:Tol biopolymer transport system component